MFGKNKRVPWARLEETQEQYIEQEYLPAGVRLKQFHHMRADVINALLQHWSERQAAGKIPFRFRKLDKANPRAMRTGSADIKEGSSQGGEGQAYGGASDDMGEKGLDAAQNDNMPTAPGGVRDDVAEDGLHSEGHGDSAENVSGII